MELGPIFRALLKNRTRFVLIAVEVGLTLAIVVNCVHQLNGLRTLMLKPSGIADEAGLLAITVNAFDPSLQGDAGENRRVADITRLRSLPGVTHAARIDSIPLSGGGSSSGTRRLEENAERVPGPYFFVSAGWRETLGVELSAGQDFDPEDYALERPRKVVLTEALAQRLFPDGGALGQRITTGSEEDAVTVVGLVRHMTNSWPTSQFANLAMFLPGQPSAPRRDFYLARVTPGLGPQVKTAIEDALLAEHSGRTLSIQSLAEVRAETFRQERLLARLLGGLVALLVFVTALGIVGVTSFSVTQRTRQIGTRRALGATREEILRYFLIENWLVTTTGLVLGVLLAFVLNDSLGRLSSSSRLPFGLVLGGMVFFWLLGLATALVPALRATRVAPVIATRAV